jgi:hypothetical protein
MASVHVAEESARRFRRRPPRRSGHGPLLPPLIAFAAVAGLAFAYIGYVLWPRWPGPPTGLDAPALPISIGGVAFNIPPAAIRVPVQRRGGSHERIDLAFLWPSLEPPEASLRAPLPAASDAAPAPMLDRIFLTIATAGNTLAPDDRVLTIYPRYTAGAATDGPGGLTMLAFREGTPYQGEDLIYDGSAPGFLVRCSRAGPGPTPGTCLYERRVGGADLVVRLPRDWLVDWRNVNANIERLIAKLQSTHVP